MVNRILLEDNACATVIIRDSRFIGGSGTDEDYTFAYESDSTLTTSGLVTGTKTAAPTAAPTANPTVNPSADPTVSPTTASTTTTSLNSNTNGSDSDPSSSSGNGYDSHGLVGFFGGHVELILIVLAVSVCVIIVCCCVVIRSMKLKNERRKNVQLEFDENLANNLSGDDKSASGDHGCGQTEKKANTTTEPDDEVEMPPVKFETVTTLKSLSPSSLGFHNADGDAADTDDVLDDYAQSLMITM